MPDRIAQRRRVLRARAQAIYADEGRDLTDEAWLGFLWGYLTATEGHLARAEGRRWRIP